MAQSASQKGGPTPRRSTRASTVARSVASLSVVSATAGNSATPSRSRALPKLDPRTSTAYGASGRITAAKDLTLPTTGFAQAFESQRIAAASRGGEPREENSQDDGHSRSGALSPESDQRSDMLTPDGAATPSLPDDESEDPLSDEDDEEESAANTSKSYGMFREAGMLRALTPPLSRAPKTFVPARGPAQAPASALFPNQFSSRFERRRVLTNGVDHGRPQPAPDQPIAAEQPLRAHVQPPLRQAEVEWWKLVKKWSIYLLGLSALFFAILLVKPGNFTAVTSALPSLSSTTPDLSGHPIDDTAQAMIDWIKEHHNRLDSRITTTHDTVSHLQSQLPKYVAVTKEKDGSLRIDDAFWNALASKMKAEMEADGLSGGMSEDWETWLRANQVRVNEILEKPVDASQAHPHALTREHFTQAMEKIRRDLAQLVDEKIAEHAKDIQKQNAEYASRVQTDVKKTLAKGAFEAYADQVRLQSLASAVLISNMELNLKKPNYFSSGLGAVVDTRITSPTNADSPAWQARYARWMMGTERRPPSTALERWDEVGDCWCAAPSTSGKGKTQLAINLAHRIVPKQITVEHIPKAMAPREDVTNAPKNVELWVKQENWTFQRSFQSKQCQPEDNNPMPEGWVCLGSVRYDIFSENHVQTFNLPDVDISSATNQVILRVRDNWGADQTCIYRVRLHGEHDEANVVYQSTD